MLEAAVQNRDNAVPARSQKLAGLTVGIPLRRNFDELDRRTVVHRLSEPVARFIEPLENVVRCDDGNPRLLGLARDASADPAEQGAEKDREKRPQEEENERL
jgi:hypothetical protein